MELMLSLVRMLFVFFLIYTLIYILHWIFGMGVAVNRFSDFHKSRSLVKLTLPDRITKDVPVAVLIPAHNEQACIVSSIESLLEEDYPSLHLIVVDDGSSDQTVSEILSRFDLHPASLSQIPDPIPTRPVRECYHCRIRDKELTLICKQNGGKADALNCALNYCSADYAIVMDADTQIECGSTRILVSRFLSDPDTIVCAGTVRNSNLTSPGFRALSLPSKCLILFQTLEYFRTFYMQRILFDRINANIIVSGAFAMFDCGLLRAIGGYRPNTIGEDMELTMRLHAFCQSQSRPYRIRTAFEARCRTQVPFRYRDFFSQRRRWHIGMIQSMLQHIYMVGSLHYGWPGIIAGSFVVLYELFAPFMELLGLCTLVLAHTLGILHLRVVCMAAVIYGITLLLTQSLLIQALRTYGIEPMSPMAHLRLFLVSILELIVFHPMNMLIKLNAFLSFPRHRKTWGNIRRSA